jgi:hypothetical protein
MGVPFCPLDLFARNETQRSETCFVVLGLRRFEEYALMFGNAFEQFNGLQGTAEDITVRQLEYVVFMILAS